MPREHALAPHRLAPVLVIFVLALVALLALRGPTWWQRVYYPLRYETTIAREAAEADVDPYLVAALINSESGFDHAEISSAGAVGLMQLLPSTADELAEAAGVKGPVGVDELLDPDTNIAIGVYHLADLLERYGDTRTALAAYNAGGGNVDEWLEESGEASVGVSLPFPETEAYVERVLSEVHRYRELYPGVF